MDDKEGDVGDGSSGRIPWFMDTPMDFRPSKEEFETLRQQSVNLARQVGALQEDVRGWERICKRVTDEKKNMHKRYQEVFKKVEQDRDRFREQYQHYRRREEKREQNDKERQRGGYSRGWCSRQNRINLKIEAALAVGARYGNGARPKEDVGAVGSAVGGQGRSNCKSQHRSAAGYDRDQCKRCGGRNHWQYECPHYVVCYRCKGEHAVKDCREPKRCYKCGREGHISDSCPCRG